MKVLLIEDNPSDARLVGAMIANRDPSASMQHAQDLESGLELAVGDPIDLLLLDLSLPDSTGLETLDRAATALGSTPIVVLTGEDDQVVATEAVRLGAQDYLQKGKFRADALWRTMGYAVQRKKAELERLELEKQLHQSQRLQSLGQLSAGIAHEINTPAQYVGDNARFLQESFGELETLLGVYARLADEARRGEVQEDTLSAVEAAVAEVDPEYLREEIPRAIEQSLDGLGRISSIVLAMKEFSHPGLEQMTSVDLNRALESTATVCRNEWKYHAELEFDLDPELSEVQCLPSEINQVFLNIIVNAAHAIADRTESEGGGLGRIAVSTRSAEEHVEIRIQDDGGGMPEDVRERIFDPFFTTKGVGKGTGQGLALAHNVVVQKHGGSIHADTEVGVGTTFVLRLPLEPPTAPEEDQAR